jgi:site-specific DNA-methyltransferase (adenine-specific)
MQIYQRPLTDIKPYEKNPRQKYDIKKVADSIKEFGFQQPIVVDRAGVIIVGHGRYQASKSLGLETVPVIIADLPPEKAKAYRIADNKTNEYSDWDIGLLQQEFTDLLDINYDLELTGFDADELEKLIVGEKEGLTDEDAVPETPEEPKAQLGDIYKLGEHRLMCGDSTIIDQVENLMNNNKADVLFTDPPYNIDFKPQRGTHDKILNDSMDSNKFKEFLNDVLTNAFSIQKKDTYSFIWCGWSTIRDFHNAIENIYEIKSLNIWVKNNFGIGYYTRPKYEPFFLCLNGNPKKPIKAPADVWEYDKVSKTLHSCEKPVGLIKNIFDIFDLGKIVYEPFGGSGSTLIACEKTNRKCYTMELDPKYIDVIIKRWEQYTGQKAEKIN